MSLPFKIMELLFGKRSLDPKPFKFWTLKTFPLGHCGKKVRNLHVSHGLRKIIAVCFLLGVSI